ncbi:MULTISPECIES: hypothetical protein [Catellatospora]|uniref:Uncharacterized protein n=2 Tax=Catellatospora TaxID=53365 RepID=A0A8J3KF84_9ACTN|nr:MULTISPECIES: hypothetical protein [Catellatospora]RKE08999.1 hypothetical protein C8E86_3875 [Catellatospora citrea]GIF88760.1 hypothetical protein Cch02nite_22040 [Catellatospora chokoriensis]GIG01853.1 hypothetical protein Cci01nite_69460 [Catellatospora citrea]
MLGIDGYDPVWHHDAGALAAAHRNRFARVIGQPLVGSWLVWDLDAEAWFTGGPVVFGFPDANIEITHRKFDECAISWDTIDLQAQLDWPGLRLDWWADTHPAILSARGRPLTRVNLIERISPTAWRPHVLHALEFFFGDLRVALFNAMDENGLTGEPEVNLPVGFWRRIPVA